MTALAGEYFRDVAQATGVELPEVLSGDSVRFVEEPLRLPIHTVSLKQVQTRRELVDAGVAGQLALAGDFLHKVEQSLYEDAPTLQARNTSYKRRIQSFFDDTVPDGILTGHLEDFAIEAVAGFELPGSLEVRLDRRQRAEHAQADHRRKIHRHALALGTAHLLVTAELHSGRSLGRVGKLVRIAVEGGHDTSYRLNGIVKPPQVLLQPLEVNEAVVLLSARKSRGRGWYAERGSKLRPYKGGLERPR